MKKILERIVNLYLRKTNPVRWARRLGVTVGNETMISPDALFPTEPYLITIGSHVQVTSGVAFFTHGGGNIIRKQLPDFDAFGKIVVEDWAYLGARSMIMPGVTIGEGALVAAGSVVTKSVPSGIVVAGNPAKKICSVDDFISKNMPFNLHTKGISAKEKKRILLSVEDSRLIHK